MHILLLHNQLESIQTTNNLLTQMRSPSRAKNFKAKAMDRSLNKLKKAMQDGSYIPTRDLVAILKKCQHMPFVKYPKKELDGYLKWQQSVTGAIYSIERLVGHVYAGDYIISKCLKRTRLLFDKHPYFETSHFKLYEERLISLYEHTGRS